jgi:ferritin
MSAWFESINLAGFAHWMRIQHQEETEHAMKFFDFINNRGERVTLKAIDQPTASFGSPLDALENTLDHEQKVTSLINRLYAQSMEESDYSAQVFLQWFINEQVEEEKTASEIVEQLKMVGDNGTGLLMLDARLGERAAA